MNNIVEENQRDGSQSIIVEGLSKTYRNSECEPGLGAAIKGFIRKRYQEVEAVKEIFFTVGRGEVVGFIGPNGAGKTTTLKMLSGLFLPSLGTASVLGYLTWKQQPRTFDSLIQMARYPVGIYPGFLWLVLTWIIPVGIITTVPAQILSGSINPLLFAGAGVLTILLFVVATILFRTGLGRYISASS